jgi:energy-coupling factor transport system permease protein
LDTTRLADSLVQHARLPWRFAYATVAALGLASLVAADWSAIGATRRLRGLEPRWLHGRVAAAFARLFTLLVATLRRAERTALAMDARGFDSGLPRSRYRPVSMGWLDVAVLAGAIAAALVIVLVGR